MDKLNNNPHKSTCSICQESHIVPYSGCQKFLKKTIDNYKKDKNKK